METLRRYHLKFELNWHIHGNSPAEKNFDLVPMGLITYPKPPWTVWQLAIAGLFGSGCWGIMQLKVDIPSVFRLVNPGVPILMGEICIFRMQRINEFKIGSICRRIDDTLECVCNSGNCHHQDWFKGLCKCWTRLQWSSLDLWLAAGYWILCPQQIPLPFVTDNPGNVFCAISTHMLGVFPHKIDKGNPITTFSVSSLHIISAATEVKVLPRPILSATSAPCKSESQTHLLTMIHTAQTWCTRKFFPGRPGMEYLWPGTQSLVDRRIGWPFSRLTASARQSLSNSLFESQPWKLNLATMGGYLSPFCQRALSNPSPVSCCHTVPSSWAPKPRLHISSKTSQPVVADSIWHYQKFQNAASSQMSPKNLQLLSPSAGVHLAAVSNGSLPRQWTDASSPES